MVREFLCEAEEVEDEVHESASTERLGEIRHEDLLGGNALLERMAGMMAVTLLKLYRDAAAMESGPEQRQAVLEVARELHRLRRADYQRQKMRLLMERQPAPPEEELRERRRAREGEDYDRQSVKLRRRAECYRSEYVTGKADGTLDPEREEWIEAFFDEHFQEIRDAGGQDLPPEEDDEEEEVQEAEAEPHEAKPAKRSKKSRRAAETRVEAAGSENGDREDAADFRGTERQDAAATMPPDAVPRSE